MRIISDMWVECDWGTRGNGEQWVHRRWEWRTMDFFENGRFCMSYFGVWAGFLPQKYMKHLDAKHIHRTPLLICSTEDTRSHPIGKDLQS